MIDQKNGWLKGPQRVCTRSTKLGEHVLGEQFLKLLKRSQRVTQTHETTLFLQRMERDFARDGVEVAFSEADHIRLENAAKRGSRGLA